MSSTLNVILSHQPPAWVEKMIARWSDHVERDSILIAYGGTLENFAEIAHPLKVFVDDERLRTHDHQRELQSYTGVFQSAAEYLHTKACKVEFVHFAEYDHLPLASDLNARQIERLTTEKADVLGFHLREVDGTNDPHFLYHAANHQFAAYWRHVTRRSVPEVVLSMFGSGSFWRYEAFCAVAARDEPFPIYMEIYLPTLAHHLGFRVRDFGEQNRFVRALRDETNRIEEARKQGAWSLHPVKHLWQN